MKAGKIYKAIAKGCLEAWYPDMGIQEREQLLERGDFDEIESYIGAKNSIESAAAAVSDFLDLFGYQYHALPQISLYSEDPAGDIERTKGIMQFSLYLDETEKVEVVLEALKRIHSKWVEDNRRKFDDPKRRDRRFMFLPLQYLGWEEASKDYIFLKPILDLLGISPELTNLRRAYKHKQLHYFEQAGYPEDLFGGIRQELCFLRQIIFRCAGEPTEEEIKEVVEQVKTRCPVLR